MNPNLTLTPDLSSIVEAHATRQGSSAEAALVDLVRRGAAQMEWREIREGVEDIRSVVLDTFEALDALAPYPIASLQLLAHWAARTGASRLSEVDYAEEARAVGQATWESHLSALDIPLPPKSERDVATEPES